MYSTGQHKQFSRQDLEISDPQSKKVAVEALQSIDPKFYLATPLDQQPEMYKLYDFTMMYGDAAITVETERKLVWTTSDGTFSVYGTKRPTVDVSGRKWESTAKLFIMHNVSFDALCMTEMKNVLAAPLNPKNTKIGTKGELFFNVPVEKFQFYVLLAGVWQRHDH